MGNWLLFLFLVGESDPTLKQQSELRPLEGALWEGLITIKIEGPLYSQFLTNKTLDNGKPVGFIKEKGEMSLDFTLEIRFLVNPLGEYTLVAVESFKGRQTDHYELRYSFREEKIVEKTRIKIDRVVQVSEAQETDVRFERESSYHDGNFDFGSFRLFPSGRMDRKGELRVMGNLTIPYQGSGTHTFVKERQPPSEEDDQVRKAKKIEREFVLPLRFDFEISHRKKEVTGFVKVEVPVENPFGRMDEKTGSKSIFTNSSNVTGSYRLTPLFDQ